MGTKTRQRPGQRRKSIEEVVQYAVSHRLRLQILIVLNEGVYSASQIAEIIGERPNNVANHVKELLDGGSIEIARTEQKGNVVQHYYRAVEIPYYSQEDAEAMTQHERQVTAGLIVQSAVAEAMAALWAGKLADPRTVLSWDWYNLDQQGRDEFEAEMRRHIDRVCEIEAKATNRRARSGEEAVSVLHTLFGYERARKPAKFPPS